jgi:hypothetical protein
MSEDKIDHLIQKLRLIKIQEADLLSQIEEENRRREQEAILARNATAVTRENPKINPSEIAVGDRIWIKNKLKKPATWTSNRPWVEKEGRTATVTGFATGRTSSFPHR